MTLEARITAAGPKKILTLDGGGIRGMMTVEVLAEIETLLRQKLGVRRIPAGSTTTTQARRKP